MRKAGKLNLVDTGSPRMTKGELRRARRAAKAAGHALSGELRLDRRDPQGAPAAEWSESPAGYRARERWARRYDALNGAPEGDWDR